MIVEEFRTVSGTTPTAPRSSRRWTSWCAPLPRPGSKRDAQTDLALVQANTGRHVEGLVTAVRASALEAMAERIDQHISLLRHFETAICPGCRAGGTCELAPKKETMS